MIEPPEAGFDRPRYLCRPERGTQRRHSGNTDYNFHRPGKIQSAIREAEYKLFVKWTPQGKIASRELYRVNENAIEQGHDLAQKEEDRADALEKRLLEYLSSVNAEQPKPKNGNRKRGSKATRKNQNS